MTGQRVRIGGLLGLALLGLGLFGLTLFAGMFSALEGAHAGGSDCALPSGDEMAPGAGPGAVVGATEYGGPGDPSSGTVGASGVNLDSHPDS